MTESLPEAFDRLGIPPLPSVEELQGLTDSQRREAVAASGVSADQYDELPAWYRAEVQRRAEETIARRAADRLPDRRVS